MAKNKPNRKATTKSPKKHNKQGLSVEKESKTGLDLELKDAKGKTHIRTKLLKKNKKQLKEHHATKVKASKNQSAHVRSLPDNKKSNNIDAKHPKLKKTNKPKKPKK